VIAAIDAAAYDGTDYVLAGQIDFEVDGTPGGNDMPGRIVFKTTADGGVLPTTRWTVKSTGHLLSGTDGTGAYNILTAGTLGAGATGAGATTLSGALDIGANTFTVNSIEIVGSDGEVNKAAVEDSGNWDDAYTHSQDNSQAHTDYLINNGDDTTSGTLTMANCKVADGGYYGNVSFPSAIEMQADGDISFQSGELFVDHVNTRIGLLLDTPFQASGLGAGVTGCELQTPTDTKLLVSTSGAVGVGYASLTLQSQGATNDPYMEFQLIPSNTDQESYVRYNYVGSSVVVAIMTIKGNNRVGIGGIAAPDETLHVNGKVKVEGNILLNGNWLSGDGGNEGIYVDSAGSVGIGTSTIPHGGVGWGKVAIDGNGGTSTGAHVQFTHSADDRPVMQMLHFNHDNVAWSFDAYYAGSWVSSDSGSSFGFYKGGSPADTFRITYGQATAGQPLTWQLAWTLDVNGNITTENKNFFRDSAIGLYSQADTFLDIFADGAIRIGDSSAGAPTNYSNFEADGALIFVGTAGLCYAEIYANNASSTITITGSGQANKVQITSFDSNGASNNMTPDHTNDHITVTKAGHYLCTVSLHIESAGGGGSDTFGFSVYKNNGGTEFSNCHGHRKLAGGGGDVGSVSLSGIIDLAVNDTIELWCWNEDSTDDLVVEDVSLSLTQIGGT
jgi:hypothetical protein